VPDTQADAGSSFNAFAVAVSLAKRANRIEALERESKMFNAAVTGRTCFDGLMLPLSQFLTPKFLTTSTT